MSAKQFDGLLWLSMYRVIFLSCQHIWGRAEVCKNTLNFRGTGYLPQECMCNSNNLREFVFVKASLSLRKGGEHMAEGSFGLTCQLCTWDQLQVFVGLQVSCQFPKSQEAGAEHTLKFISTLPAPSDLQTWSPVGGKRWTEALQTVLGVPGSRCPAFPA